jgi:hypothetical protein
VNQLAESNIEPDEAAAAHLRRYIDFIYKTRDKYFGNGRSVRKVIEEAVRNQHLRLSELPKPKQTKKAIGTLTIEDVDEFSTDIKPSTPGGGIGFRV